MKSCITAYFKTIGKEKLIDADAVDRLFSDYFSKDPTYTGEKGESTKQELKELWENVKISHDRVDIAIELMCRILDEFKAEISNSSNNATENGGDISRKPPTRDLLKNLELQMGWVYFLVECPWSGLVKIGKTQEDSVAKRVSDLNTGNPRCLVN